MAGRSRTRRRRTLFCLAECTNLPGGLPHTDPLYYLPLAAQWAHAYITGPGDAGDTLNLYDVSGLAHFELYRAITLAGNPSGLATTQAALLADLQKQLNKAIARARKIPLALGSPGRLMTQHRTA